MKVIPIPQQPSERKKMLKALNRLTYDVLRASAKTNTLDSGTKTRYTFFISMTKTQQMALQIILSYYRTNLGCIGLDSGYIQNTTQKILAQKKWTYATITFPILFTTISIGELIANGLSSFVLSIFAISCLFFISYFSGGNMLHRRRLKKADPESLEIQLNTLTDILAQKIHYEGDFETIHLNVRDSSSKI